LPDENVSKHHAMVFDHIESGTQGFDMLHMSQFHKYLSQNEKLQSTHNKTNRLATSRWTKYVN